MNYIEKYTLLKFYNCLDIAYITQLAKIHKQTVKGFQYNLQQDVCYLPNLNLKQKNWLFQNIPNMTEEEIVLLEKVNHQSISKIINFLESEVKKNE